MPILIAKRNLRAEHAGFEYTQKKGILCKKGNAYKLMSTDEISFCYVIAEDGDKVLLTPIEIKNYFIKFT